jgi:hypothetical protein
VRRFLLQRLADPTGVSGLGIVAEGCIFGDGTTVVRWRGDTATTTVHASFASVERIHLHGGATRALWCDTSDNGPRTERAPDRWLHDGWFEPNGAVDCKGKPLHKGQAVRLVGTHGEVKDDGEITDFHVSDQGVRVGVIGADCGLCGYSTENVEGTETHKETLDRNGGVKPSYGWAPAVRIEGKA